MKHRRLIPVRDRPTLELVAAAVARNAPREGNEQVSAIRVSESGKALAIYVTVGSELQVLEIPVAEDTEKFYFLLPGDDMGSIHKDQLLEYGMTH